MKIPFAILAASVASCLSVPVAAQLPTEPVDQIIVTAARAPLDVGAAGSAVTIITADDIERRQARYVTDVLRAVPGFAVSHAGVAGSQTQVRVRGSEANHVLVLIDGVRANDPATGDEFRWEFLTTANIERIEVVRGPQTSLWGSDAVAAVVHVITQSGDAGRSVGGYLEGGTENTLNAALHGGSGGERWSLSGSIERLATDGFNIARTGDEQDDSDITTATLAASARPVDGVNFRLGARLVDAWSQFDAVDFFVTGLPTDSDVATETRQNLIYAGSVFGAAQSRVVHRLNVRWFDTRNDNRVDGNADSGTTSERLTLSYQADLRLGANLLSLALEHEATDFTQYGAALFGDPNQAQTMETSSAIADFQGRASERFTWLLSARFDDNSDFDDALTGRLSLAWDAGESTRLRASLGTGRKNPTFIERFGFFPGQFVGNPGLEPERSTSVDIGVDRQLTDALSAQLTVFRQDLEDEINGFVFDPVTFLSTAENMDGSSERSGVEVAARWAPSDRVAMDASYTYTDSSADGDVRELRRPRHAGSLHLDYRFLDARARIAIAADYGGTRLDVFFPPFPEPSQVVTLDSFWVVDLAAHYALTPATSLFARVGNLLDESYEQVYGYRTPGRAAFAGVQMNFGR